MNGRDDRVGALHTRIEGEYELKLPGAYFARLGCRVTKGPVDQTRDTTTSPRSASQQFMASVLCLSVSITMLTFVYRYIVFDLNEKVEGNLLVG